VVTGTHKTRIIVYIQLNICCQGGMQSEAYLLTAVWIYIIFWAFRYKAAFSWHTGRHELERAGLWTASELIITGLAVPKLVKKPPPPSPLSWKPKLRQRINSPYLTSDNPVHVSPPCFPNIVQILFVSQNLQTRIPNCLNPFRFNHTLCANLSTSHQDTLRCPYPPCVYHRHSIW
jgi:hypothetical protein